MQYRYEVRIITEKANFVFHLWDKEKEGESTGKNKEEYDLSNNAEFTSTKDNSIKVEIEKIDNEEHYRTFDITRYSGIWTGNFIVFCVYDNGYVFDDNGERSMELVDFFLTDEQGGNKKTLISEPEKVTALIDYHNNVVRDSLILARHLGEKLNGVRIDTSKALVDHYFDDKDTSGFDPHGVCKELVFTLRKALDDEGFNYVRITVSSSFSAEKIEEWVKEKVPVSMYGVGTYFVNNTTCGFTGDLVMRDGKPQAKEGRANYPNPRLKKVPYPIY